MSEQLGERRSPLSAEERMKIFREQFGKNEFSRKDYLENFKAISAPTASRDLKAAVDKKTLKRKGEKRLSVYNFLK